MLAKFNRRSSDLSVVAYLLRDTDWKGEPRPAPPEVVYGDPDRFDQSLRAANYSQQYMSGELTWGENEEDVGRDRYMPVLHEFLHLLTGGQRLRDFSILAVLHKRLKGFDIHFVLSRLNLRSGRQFRFFRNTPHDREMFNTWRRIQNLMYGWTDPEDPECADLRSRPSRYERSSDQRDAHTKLDDTVVELVRNGSICSREDIVNLLKEKGATVHVHNHRLDLTYENTSLRLLGKKYSRRFDWSTVRRDAVPGRSLSSDVIALEIGDLEQRFCTRRDKRAKLLANEHARDARPVSFVPMSPTAGAESGDPARPREAGRHGGHLGANPEQPVETAADSATSGKAGDGGVSNPGPGGAHPPAGVADGHHMVSDETSAGSPNPTSAGFAACGLVPSFQPLTDTYHERRLPEPSTPDRLSIAGDLLQRFGGAVKSVAAALADVDRDLRSAAEGARGQQSSIEHVVRDLLALKRGEPSLSGGAGLHAYHPEDTHVAFDDAVCRFGSAVMNLNVRQTSRPLVLPLPTPNPPAPSMGPNL
jgi:hypothetical protein